MNLTNITKKIEQILNVLPKLENIKNDELTLDLENKKNLIIDDLKKLNKPYLKINEKKELVSEILENVLYCLDTCELSKNYPLQAQKILKLVLSTISITCPVLIPVTTIVCMFPEEWNAKIVEVSGFFTLEHQINKSFQYFKNQKQIVAY